jgi:hypothetical protein
MHCPSRDLGDAIQQTDAKLPRALAKDPKPFGKMTVTILALEVAGGTYVH